MVRKACSSMSRRGTRELKSQEQPFQWCTPGLSPDSSPISLVPRVPSPHIQYVFCGVHLHCPPLHSSFPFLSNVPFFTKPNLQLWGQLWSLPFFLSFLPYIHTVSKFNVSSCYRKGQQYLNVYIALGTMLWSSLCLFHLKCTQYYEVYFIIPNQKNQEIIRHSKSFS